MNKALTIVKKLNRLGIVAAVLIGGFIGAEKAAAQNYQHTQHKVDQTLRSNARVNPTTLAVEMSLPIADMSGRGGVSMPLVFNYSSKVWELRATGVTFGPPNYPVEARPLYSSRAMAGWTSSYGIPRIDSATELHDCYGNATSDLAQLPPNCGQYYYVKKVRVILPGGTAHELRKDDEDHTTTTGAADKTGTYYAVDSSRARLEWGTGGISTLFLPDGGRYFFNAQEQCERYIDRHGNKLEYNQTTGAWTDTLGRVLTAPIPFTSQQIVNRTEGTQTFEVPGLGTSTREYQLVWKKLSSSGTLADGYTLSYDASRCNPIVTRSPQLFENTWAFKACSVLSGYFDPVVLTEIVLPNGQKYKFAYTNYGEIARIDYPTGAYEKFVYEQVRAISWDYEANSYIAESYAQSNRGVTHRYVGTGGGAAEQHWQYAVSYVSTVHGNNTYLVTTTAPDNTVGKRYLHRSRNPMLGSEYGNYGFDTALAGMEIETQTLDTNGAIRSRKLLEWEVTTAASPQPNAVPERDPRLKREISLVFEPGATSALAIMSETVYDTIENSDPAYFSHLNVKKWKAYNYKVLASGTAQTAALQTIAEEFSESDVVSVSETDYLYNEGYKARGIIGLPSETRVMNPANPTQFLAKSQVVFDEQNQYYSMADYGATVGYEAPTGSYAHLRGNATTFRTWFAEENRWIETHAQYDNFGNVRKVWDSSGDPNRFVETEYASQYYFAYPTRKIAPAPNPTGTHGTTESSAVSTSYDFATGRAISVTDANGQVTTMEYDALLRPKKVIPPAGGAIAEKEYGDTPGSLFVKTRAQVDAQNWAETTAFMDNLGRVYKTQTKDLQGDIFSEIEYDSFGRVERVSNPYRQGEQKFWSKPRYDIANRVVETYAPAPDGQTGASMGTVEFGISTIPGLIGNYVTATDASGRKARSITNIFGQVVRVDEPTGNNDLGSLETPNQASYYTYNIKGELVKIQQGNQNQTCQTVQCRFFMYDSLGRLVRVRQPEQIPHASLATTGNPDNNQWTSGFSYDVFGNVISVTDAKGMTITNNFDKAGRIITSGYSDGATPQVNYFYDGTGLGLSQAPPFSKGSLTKISNGVSEERYTSFDNYGRVLASQQMTDGQTFTFGYKYDDKGNLIEETYPSGRVVKTHLDTDGGLSAVSSKTATSPYKTYASNFSYTATGSIKAMMLGNGRWETAIFNERFQTTQIGLGNASTDTSLWKVNYDYGELNENGTVDTNKNIGNVAKQTITAPAASFVQTYKYDALNRLTEARETADTTSGTENWKQTFGYDRYGNRTGFYQKVGSNVLPIDNKTKPQVDPNTNRFTTAEGYVYDFNGNLIQDAENRGFTFNGDDQQTVVRDLTIPTSQENPDANVIGRYYYDGEGKRVKKVTNTETVVFVYNAAGALAAEYSTATPPANPTTSYLTTDNLGSPRVITDKTGAVISRRDFMPFGEEILAGVGARDAANLKYSASGIDNIRQRFTGYQKDEETDLDFAEARMYKNSHGRFTAPDPLLASASLSNPQTFNRYVYVGNNPVNLTDPNGLDWCQAEDKTTTYRPGTGTCKSNEKHIPDDSVGEVLAGCFNVSGGGAACAGEGKVISLNNDGTVRVLNPNNQQDNARIAAVVGVQVQWEAQEIIQAAGDTILTTITSAAQTLAEDFGATPLPVAHNTAGRAIGHLTALSLSAAGTALGGSLIGAGFGGEIVGLGLNVTGVGAIIGVPTVVVSTIAIGTGAIIATGSIALGANTIVNIYNQTNDSSSGGSSSGSGKKSAQDYPETKDRNKTFEGAEAQRKGLEKAIEKDKKIPREKRKLGYVKRPDRSKQRADQHLKRAKGKSSKDFLDDLEQ